MNFKLRRFLNKIAVPNLMMYICFTQGLVFVADLLTKGQLGEIITFSRAQILTGQVWRVITFLGEPVNPHPVWIVVSILFYISISRTIEAVWGADRLTHYLIVNWLLSVAMGFLLGYAVNYYMFLSLILVYGTLCPREQINLYMVLPIEVRVLAIAYAVLMLIWLILGNWFVIPSILTYLIFFGKAQIFVPLINKIKHRNFFKKR